MSGRAVSVLLATAGASGAALFALPVAGLVLRAGWGASLELLTSRVVYSALALSALVSFAAVALALALGFPLAWGLARGSFPGKRLLRTLVTLPMVMPPVVAGVALLAAFGPGGLAGGPLERIGMRLPFTTAAAVIAAAFVSAPFLVTALEAGIAQVDPRLERVAATFGASRSHSFRTVLLPAIRPSLAGGIALCWARALGEFGATITFAGNLQGRTQTAPLAIYQILQLDPERAFLLAAFLLVASVAVLAGLRGRRVEP